MIMLSCRMLKRGLDRYTEGKSITGYSSWWLEQSLALHARCKGVTTVCWYHIEGSQRHLMGDTGNGLDGSSGCSSGLFLSSWLSTMGNRTLHWGAFGLTQEGSDFFRNVDA